MSPSTPASPSARWPGGARIATRLIRQLRRVGLLHLRQRGRGPSKNSNLVYRLSAAASIDVLEPREAQPQKKDDNNEARRQDRQPAQT